MFATDELRKEHDAILTVLAVLDHLGDELQAGKAVRPDHLEQIIDFLCTFADRCHHGKEEDLLFPALSEAGIPVENGPIGVMLTEHDNGRAAIRAMAEALPGVKQNDRAAAYAFGEAAKHYCRLLSAHIHKENNVLFTMAEQLLGPEDHARMQTAFDKVESDRIGPGVHEKYHALIHDLAERYLGAIA